MTESPPSNETSEQRDDRKDEDDDDESDEEEDEHDDEEDDETDDEEDDATDESGMVAVETEGQGGGVVVSTNASGEETAPWRLAIGGYTRTRYTSIQNDPDVDFVGRHDGFTLADARLQLEGRLPAGLGFTFELDAAVSRDMGSANSPIVETDTAAKSIFAYYQPIPEFRVSVGQFEPPYDLEELLPTEHFLFIRQSVGSRGVQNIEGFNVDGLSRTREVGIRLDGEPYYPFASGDDPESLGFSAQLAATNGQSVNRNLNDNDKLAYYGRASVHWAELVRLGGGYFHNDQEIGEAPDRLDVTTTGWTADLLVDVLGLTAFGSVSSVRDDPSGEGLPEADQTGFAYQAQIGYEEPFLGFQPVYRYAYYDPTWEVEGSEGLEFENDARTHHTVGLNYNSKGYPVRVMVNYTFTQEQDARELKNNRFDAAVQLSW